MVNLEKEIVNAALDIAELEGWENVSIRKIAQKIGYSTMKVYSEFDSKEKLFFEIQKIGFELLKTAYLNSVKKDNDTKSRLEVIFLSHFQFSRIHSTYYELMFNHKFKNYQTEVIDNKQRACEVIYKAISDIDTLYPEITFIHFFALLEGFVKISNELPNQSNKFITTTIKRINESFFSGLR